MPITAWLTDATDADLAELRPSHLPERQMAAGDQVRTLVDEQIHHGAEIALLRDLFAAPARGPPLRPARSRPCSGPSGRPSAREEDRQRLDAVHDRAVVEPQLAGVDGEREVGEAAGQGGVRRPQLHPGQLGAHAAVEAVPEGQVGRRRLGVVEAAAVG